MKAFPVWLESLADRPAAGERACLEGFMGVVEHVNQNVETIEGLRARAEGQVGRHQKVIEWLTASLGRPRVTYAIVVGSSAWIGLNWVGLAAFDPPPFVWLQGLLTLCALLLTSMVLVTQNRQSKHAEQRAQLDLQVNLLSEQKIAKVIALLEELRRDMPTVRDRVDPVADAMTEAVNPEVVIEVLERTREPAQADENEASPAPEPVPAG